MIAAKIVWGFIMLFAKAVFYVFTDVFKVTNRVCQSGFNVFTDVFNVTNRVCSVLNDVPQNVVYFVAPVFD